MHATHRSMARPYTHLLLRPLAFIIAMTTLLSFPSKRAEAYSVCLSPEARARLIHSAFVPEVRLEFGLRHTREVKPWSAFRHEGRAPSWQALLLWQPSRILDMLRAHPRGLC